MRQSWAKSGCTVTKNYKAERKTNESSMKLAFEIVSKTFYFFESLYLVMRLLSRKLGEPDRLGMDGERLRFERGLDLCEEEDDDEDELLEESLSELEESELLDESLSELEESESLEDSLSVLELESEDDERLDDRRDFLLLRGPSLSMNESSFARPAFIFSFA